jgi:hypothetical protein
MLLLYREIIVVYSDNHTNPYIDLIFRGDIQCVVIQQQAAGIVTGVL